MYMPNLTSTCYWLLLLIYRLYKDDTQMDTICVQPWANLNFLGIHSSSVRRLIYYAT